MLEALAQPYAFWTRIDPDKINVRSRSLAARDHAPGCHGDGRVFYPCHAVDLGPPSLVDKQAVVAHKSVLAANKSHPDA